MNKELILKYPTELTHWAKGGIVLMGKRNLVSNVIKWYPSITNPFIEESKSIVIVINDKYVEFRKALAENKTIQYENSNLNEVWNFIDLTEEDLKQRDISTYCINRLRIKPDEPKFKVGDWVRSKEYGVIKLNKDNVNSYNKYTDTRDPKSAVYTELWKPKPKEYIWDCDFGLSIIINVTDSEGILCRACFDDRREFTAKLNEIEPFIGSLPSKLKEE